MNKILPIAVLLLSIAAANAQPAADLLYYQQEFKNADAVFLNNNRDVVVTLEGGKISIEQSDYEELMLLGNNVNKYSESSVAYSGFIDLIELEAKTMVPEKNKYRTEQVKSIITEKTMDGGIFYDDAKSKRIFFSGLQPGAKRVVSYKQQVKMPQLLPPFYFQSYAPCEKSAYTILVPEGVNIEYRLFNVPDNDVTFSVEQTKEGKMYKWELKNVAALLFLENDAPNIRYFMPHLVVRVKNYAGNGKSNNVLSSSDDLYKWYYGFVKNMNLEQSPRLQLLVDSLTRQCKTDREKASQILYWVQNNIRYVAFEDGMQGFIPRQADSVCVKRYGDCKDMSSILTAMLKQAGLKAYPTWVGTRDIPYTYAQMPSPLADNHMIAALKLEDQYYFLDATSNHLTFGYPSSFIQGKEALIGIDSEKYHIELIPEMAPEKNLEVDTFRLSINGKMLNGHDVKHFSGYRRQNFSYFLNNLDTEDFKEGLEGYLSVGNNKFRLDTFQIINRYDQDQPLIVKNEFHVADYIQQVTDEIYINLNLDRTYYNDLIDTSTRQLDREEEYKDLQKQHYELEIPAGYVTEYLPQGKSFDNDMFGFDISYKQVAGKIILDKSIYINFLMLHRKDFSEWNKMIRELNKAYNEAIILKKKL